MAGKQQNTSGVEKTGLGKLWLSAGEAGAVLVCPEEESPECVTQFFDATNARNWFWNWTWGVAYLMI